MLSNRFIDTIELSSTRACQNSSINLISSNSALNNITNTNIAAAAAAAAAAASSSYAAAGAAAAAGTAAAAATSPSFSTGQKIRFHERRGSLIRLSNNNRDLISMIIITLPCPISHL